VPVPFRTVLLLALLPLATAWAAPFVPSSDAEVLETLPLRIDSPGARELRELRKALAAEPQNLDLALPLAQRYFDEVAAEGDPRYIGYAQAALAPWWNLSEPPVPVRVMRAKLLQFNHRFAEAKADLDAALRAQPDHAEAWAWRAAISLVQADYAQARVACQRLQPLATPLMARACLAQIDATTGQSAAAAQALQRALREHPPTDAAESLWVLTRLAEAEQARGAHAAAETAFRQALALGRSDGYLLAAYADFLLDRGRAAEVLTLLKGRERSDLLLLRLALAAKALNDPALAAWQQELSARFAVARLRGDDALHLKEEARFTLQVLGQAAQAADLAQRNFATQREPADARILLEAALAARNPGAAQAALQWLAESGNDHLALTTPAQALKGLK